jgi:hypothetical protein
VQFWEAIRGGLLPDPAARAIGVSGGLGQRWFREAGGVINNGPSAASGRYLSFHEREEIAIGLAQGPISPLS